MAERVNQTSAEEETGESYEAALAFLANRTETAQAPPLGLICRQPASASVSSAMFQRCLRIRVDG